MAEEGSSCYSASTCHDYASDWLYGSVSHTISGSLSGSSTYVASAKVCNSGSAAISVTITTTCSKVWRLSTVAIVFIIIGVLVVVSGVAACVRARRRRAAAANINIIPAGMPNVPLLSAQPASMAGAQPYYAAAPQPYYVASENGMPQHGRMQKAQPPPAAYGYPSANTEPGLHVPLPYGPPPPPPGFRFSAYSQP